MGAGQAHDHHVDLVGHLADGAGKLLGHVQEGHHDADAQGHARQAQVGRAVQQQGAARQGHDDVGHVAHVAQQGHQDVGVAVGLLAVLEQRVVHLVKVGLGALLVAEDLDDLLAAHHLFHEALGLGDGDLLLQEVLGRVAADIAGGEEHHDDAAQHHQSQPDAVVDHDAENAQQGDARDHQLGQALADELAQGVDIIGVEAHDIAVAVGVEVADGQVLHMVEHLFAQLGQGALGDDGHQLVEGGAGRQADDVQGDQDGQQTEDGGRCGGPVAGLVGGFHHRDGVLHKDGRHRADDGVDQNAADGHRQQDRIKGKDGADQTGHDPLGGPLAPRGACIIRHPCHLLPGWICGSGCCTVRGRRRCGPSARRGCPRR